MVKIKTHVRPISGPKVFQIKYPLDRSSFEPEEKLECELDTGQRDDSGTGESVVVSVMRGKDASGNKFSNSVLLR
jgi:hypothetical protein